jgi:osmoprotectant transport system ATP-binding protein
LNELSKGRIELNGQDISTIDSDKLRREIGFVLQEAALFPHWTVAQNIGLVPRLIGKDKKWINKRVNELLGLVKLEKKYADRYPNQLSGGQAQRVSIARAIAADPAFIIFDEPFSALDPITRADLQNEVNKLKEQVGLTSVFVTHDMNEAFLLGDQIIVLNQGKVAQRGTPAEIQENPANDYVQSLISPQDG